MTTIYLITNKNNGKKYVGQTKRTAVYRYCQHIEASFRLAEGKRNCFYKEIASCGENALDVFCLTIIEICDDNIGDEREKYWIDFYKCEYNEMFKEGYIRSLSNIIVEAYNGGETMQMLSQKYKCRHQTIKDILIENNVEIKRKQGRNYKKVYEFNDDGEFLEEFENAGDCSSKTGIDRGNIRLCASCNAETHTISRTAEGRHFSYEKTTPKNLFILSKNGIKYNFKSYQSLRNFIKTNFSENCRTGYVVRVYNSIEGRNKLYGYSVDFIHDIVLRRTKK